MPLSRLNRTSLQSLNFRIALLITLLSAFITISFTSFYIIHERRIFTENLTSKGKLLASIIAAEIQMPLYAGSNEEIARRVATFFRYKQICCLRVVNSAGEQIINSSRNTVAYPCNGIPVYMDVRSSLTEKSPEAVLLGEESQALHLGRVELEMDTSDLGAMTRKLILVSLLLATLFWLGATSMTLLLLRRITATFKTLMTGVKRIEAGDLSVFIPVTNNDEPGRALAAINSLAESLLKKSAENERLQAEVVKQLHHQLDEEKTRHMAKLIQTNRMTSLGLLVSSMAHEINNPNAAIRLAAEIVEKGWKDVQPLLDELARSEGEFKLCGMDYTEASENIEQAVTAILRSSFRIEKVVENLRSYSLGDRENQFMAFDFNRVAENSVAIVRAHGKMENKIISTELAPDLPAAWGDPFQLEQVVTNLLMNSIQAMTVNDGQIVTLSTKRDPESGDPLLEIVDSGPGIPAENIPHLFEPFFSTRIGKGGSGLGLYIADFIIKEQNGSLQIENCEGGGCRARIRLPAAEAVKRLQTETSQASC